MYALMRRIKDTFSREENSLRDYLMHHSGLARGNAPPGEAPIETCASGMGTTATYDKDILADDDIASHEHRQFENLYRDRLNHDENPNAFRGCPVCCRRQ